MKKSLLLIALVSVMLTACGDKKDHATTTNSPDVKVVGDTIFVTLPENTTGNYGVKVTTTSQGKDTLVTIEQSDGKNVTKKTVTVPANKDGGNYRVVTYTSNKLLVDKDAKKMTAAFEQQQKQMQEFFNRQQQFMNEQIALMNKQMLQLQKQMNDMSASFFPNPEKTTAEKKS